MFKKLLRAIAIKFDEHEIPYIVIGGQAVLLYGEPRLTKDIDITIGLNIDMLEKILEIIQEVGLKPLPKEVSQFVQQTMVLPLIEQDSTIRVDIIFSFSPFEQQAIKRANVVFIDGTPIRYVSLEDLIIFKIFSGRPRDLEDVQKILVKNQNTDTEYIKKQLEVLSYGDRDFLKDFNQLMEGF